MRSLTTQPASDLKFLLTGRDGGKDRMVTVVAYFKGGHVQAQRFTIHYCCRAIQRHCHQAPAAMRCLWSEELRPVSYAMNVLEFPIDVYLGWSS